MTMQFIAHFGVWVHRSISGDSIWRTVVLPLGLIFGSLWLVLTPFLSRPHYHFARHNPDHSCCLELPFNRIDDTNLSQVT